MHVVYYIIVVYAYNVIRYAINLHQVTSMWMDPELTQPFEVFVKQ